MNTSAIRIPTYIITVGLLSACASSSQNLVTAPTHVRPQYVAAITEDSPGSIYQPSRAMLLFEEQIASRIGDSLKISIAENLTSSNQSKTNTSRDSTIAETGPGAMSSMGGLLQEIFNYNGKAEGKSTLTGSGDVSNVNQVSGSLIVSVTQVLPNGYMAVAGEKTVADSGNSTTLRFSGIVNRRDIKPGNVVSSNDVGEARIEHVINGVASEVASRSMMQRFFAGMINFW